MIPITKIKAREILDSRGNPTIEVDVFTKMGRYTASVPSGKSTGKYEARELRDATKRFHGLGVRKAIRNVEKKIAPLLEGKDVRKQENLDQLMIKLDKTENKSRLGANAILAVSLACAKAGSEAHNLYLFQYIQKLLGISDSKLPRPFFNVINGGKHAGNRLVFQEFMVAPRLNSFQKNLQAGSEIYYFLKKIIKKKYGAEAINVGDEGGFAPPLKNPEEALQLLKEAIKKAGYAKKIDIAMDVAASEFYKKGYYHLPRKTTKGKLLDYYLKLTKKYKTFSIEDPFEQDDFSSFAKLMKASKIQIVGDDLTVTNIERIKGAILENSCNCLLLKLNQIGTLTEALAAVRLAYQNCWKVMVSHRSGETEDTFIADLAVGIGCGQIKAGAPCRGERTAKYNRLLRIEEVLKE